MVVHLVADQRRDLQVWRIVAHVLTLWGHRFLFHVFLLSPVIFKKNLGAVMWKCSDILTFTYHQVCSQLHLKEADLRFQWTPFLNWSFWSKIAFSSKQVQTPPTVWTYNISSLQIFLNPWLLLWTQLITEPPLVSVHIIHVATCQPSDPGYVKLTLILLWMHEHASKLNFKKMNCHIYSCICVCWLRH